MSLTRVGRLVSFPSGYGAGLLVWEAARRSPMGWTDFQFLDIFAIWLLVPAPALVFLAARNRSKLGLTLVCASMIVMLVPYAQLLARPAKAAGREDLRVMTWNLRWTSRNAEALADAIERVQPDIVAIQELHPAIVPALERRLAWLPYRSVHPATSTRGMAVFSRSPIVKEVTPKMAATECSCQVVTVSTPEGEVRVINVHTLGPSRRRRIFRPLDSRNAWVESALAKIVAKARSSDRALIVGDLNLSDRQPAYREIRSVFRDAFADAGRGFGYTYPAGDFGPGIPLMRIDYIFSDESLEATWAGTGEVYESDHRYVVADLRYDAARDLHR